MNSNALLDPTEIGLPNVLLQLTNGSFQALSANSGHYEVYATAGSYLVQIPNIPLYHSLSTAVSQSAVFSGLGNVDSLNHFGLVPIPNMPDLRVTLTPLTAPKAGFVLAYLLSYKNIGTVAQNATVFFNAPSGINFISASPAASAQNGGNVEWQLGMLQPGQQGDIYVQYNIPIGTPLGFPLSSQAQITPVFGDLTMNDNSSQSQIQVVGPYDPNIKLVDKDTLYNISTSDWLEYTVHFQNVGTDTAHNVVIVDTLSTLLDLTTFEVLSMSHQPLEVNFDQQVLTFRFNQIMLPDSTTNQVGSNGFVKFRMKHPSSLAFLTEIENFVDIYFDFNDAIRTNTATTVHLDSTISGISTINHQDAFVLYPNPTNADLTIEFNQTQNESVQLMISDLSGRILQTSTLTGKVNKLNAESLTPGIYNLQVTLNGHQRSQRFIKL